MSDIDTCNVKIMRIYMDDVAADENGMGILLFVDFDHWAGISFLLDSKHGEPGFADVLTGKAGKPETDGECIYWQNGAYLTIGEMMAMVMNTPELIKS